MGHVVLWHTGGRKSARTAGVYVGSALAVMAAVALPGLWWFRLDALTAAALVMPLWLVIQSGI
jgi:hypothetical protein